MPRKLVGAACGVDFVTEDGAVLLLHRTGTITIGPGELDDWSQVWIAAHRQAEAESMAHARGRSPVGEHPAFPVPSMLWVAGKRFACPACSANVFTKHAENEFTCNGCGREYGTDEPAGLTGEQASRG